DMRPESDKKKTTGAELVNKDHPEVIELWNLVFIQYNRKANGTLEELPDKHIDTGMGFERLCMVLQHKNSSYDTDLFAPLIDRVQTLSKKKYDQSEEISVAMRVIVDHLRAVSFAIADGQLPGNTGAGYVIRRILRRAIRYGFTFLELKDPFIHKLVETLSKTMGDAFPELNEQRQLIENVIREEEHSFLKTLDQGLVLLENVIKSTKGKVISGEKAFELYDTFGFPKDLTALILEERGLSMDEEAFNAALNAQKSRSRAASEVSKEDWVILEKDNTQEFIGYELLEADVSLVKYRKLHSKKEGDQYQLVFNRTPFYAEGGGQVGDKGYLEGPGGDVIYIVDTKKENNEIVHFAKSLPKDPDTALRAVVDKKQRQRTARNHSATHLLHQALRHVLGDHVEQKGSAVHSKYLRFDFSHFAKLSEEELTKVERFVNERINEGIPLVENRNVPMQQALDDGAMALFGEKYGDAVRTIRFGDSIELCGGTHVFNTADIWYFKITSEGAIAAGVRRIEAITSDAARDYFLNKQAQLTEIKSLFKGAKDPVSAVTQLQDENTALKKELEKLQKAQAGNLKSELMDRLEAHNGIHVLAEKVELPVPAIKDLLFQMGGEREDLFILLASEANGKAMLTCYISKPLVESHSLHAGTIVRELGKHIQGGGGGQPFFATAGGKDASGIPAALAAFKEFLP
ncbi:MAG: alanine--tRNA ligase, partial [Bacteroidia bacterium]|nr:alanine--tRNA ligase [Bacteroidia bacterium]